MDRRIRSVLKILNERKNIGRIYHFTNAEGLFKVLENNQMLLAEDENGDYYFSTTRDKHFMQNTSVAIENYMIGGFELDGTGLSDNLKIEPFNYWGDGGDYSEFIKGSNNESEERVYVPDNQRSGSFYKGIRKYINKVYVYVDVIEYFFKYSTYPKKFIELATKLYPEMSTDFRNEVNIMMLEDKIRDGRFADDLSREYNIPVENIEY